MTTPRTIRDLLKQGYKILSPDGTVMVEPGGERNLMFIKVEDKGEFVIKKTLPIDEYGIKIAMNIISTMS